jgi:hypothetical protein
MTSLRSVLRRILRPLRRPKPPPPPVNEPSGPLLERARTIAFIVTNAAEANGLKWLEAAKARGAEIDMLPLLTPYQREDRRIMSILLDPPRAEYDCIVVHRAVVLFEHSWSYALLDRLNGWLSETGTIFIPRRLDPSQRISDARLKDIFGQEPRYTAPRVLGFGKARPFRRPPDAAFSTLDAYWPIRDALTESRFEPALAQTIRDLGVRRVPPRDEEPDHGTALVRARSQAYRTCSVSTKAPLVQHLAATYFPGREDLRVIDLGAGTGINSLELLLNPSGVAHVTLIERNRAYHWHIAKMVEALGARVQGKVALSQHRVENYAGTPVDIAMVCGVFSILRAGTRDAFAQSAWNAVAPGGILAVLENMRDDDPVRGGVYNATRLTPAEIDAMLGRFGTIRAFQGDALKELPLEEVANKTVFRVVQKPI